MKQLSVLFVMFLMTITTSAQKERQELREARSAKFAEMAAEEFNLSKEQQTALYERKLQHYIEQDKVKKKAKKENLTKEEKKAPNASFGKYFRKLTGKTYDELKPFYEKVQKELKKIK